jgi:hypothetical protein
MDKGDHEDGETGVGAKSPGGAEPDIVVAIRVRVAGVVAVGDAEVRGIVVPIAAAKAVASGFPTMICLIMGLP